MKLVNERNADSPNCRCQTNEIVETNADVLRVVDGLKFFVSANKVILCTGDDSGYVRPQYFRETYLRSPR